eukprot:142714_1
MAHTNTDDDLSLDDIKHDKTKGKFSTPGGPEEVHVLNPQTESTPTFKIVDSWLVHPSLNWPNDGPWQAQINLGGVHQVTIHICPDGVLELYKPFTQFLVQWSSGQAEADAIVLHMHLECETLHAKYKETKLFKDIDDCEGIASLIPSSFGAQKEELVFWFSIELIQSQKGRKWIDHCSPFTPAAQYTYDWPIQSLIQNLNQIRHASHKYHMFYGSTTVDQMFVFGFEARLMRNKQGKRTQKIILFANLLRLPHGTEAVEVLFRVQFPGHPYSMTRFLSYEQSRFELTLLTRDKKWLLKTQHKHIKMNMMLTIKSFRSHAEAVGNDDFKGGSDHEQKDDPTHETKQPTDHTLKRPSSPLSPKAVKDTVDEPYVEKSHISPSQDQGTSQQTHHGNTPRTPPVYITPTQRDMMEKLQQRKHNLDSVWTEAKTQEQALEFQLKTFQMDLKRQKEKAMKRFDAIEAAFRCEIDDLEAEINGVNDYCRETWNAFSSLEQDLSRGSVDINLVQQHIQSFDIQLPYLQEDLSTPIWINYNAFEEAKTHEDTEGQGKDDKGMKEEQPAKHRRKTI